MAAAGEVVIRDYPGYSSEHTSTGKCSRVSSSSHVDWKDGNSSRTYVSELRWGRPSQASEVEICKSSGRKHWAKRLGRVRC